MKISLDGDWVFKGYLGEDWLWRGAHQPGSNDPQGWLPGRVPGSVLDDLWRAGQIPNPYFERNSLLVEWVPARTWVYKKSFPVAEELKGQRIRLCFQGVDYSARFFLNGELLGAHKGMFTPASFEVADLLRYGQENLLAVVLDPAPVEQSQVGYSSRVCNHKSRMNYGWDFCPRMIHQGIWDAVTLDATGLARIEDVWVRTNLNEDRHRAEVRVSAEFSMGWPAASPPGFPISEGRATKRVIAFPVEVEVGLELRCQDDRVASQQTTCDITFSGGRLNTSFVVQEPELWWPNGQGEQALYELEVQVMNPLLPGQSLRTVSDCQVVRFGIRQVELIPNENASPEARPYTFSVNGRRIYANGWNWVPMDVLYGVERPEKLERLLMLARRAHVNLLRVWGGGLIERESFYDLCDRYGILVWQEFVQSSSGIENRPPEDPEFIQILVEEARQFIPRLRNHPSLALWCGGNELQDAPDRPSDEKNPMLAALRDVVAQLDPGRPWLPTSPSGPTFGNSLESIAHDLDSLHDVHGPWEHQGLVGQYELYNRGCSLFHSEFGVEGVTNQKALDEVISKDHQWPVSRDNPVWEHLGAWWIKEDRWRELFGEVKELETLVRVVQFSQASGLGYAVEADRRRQYHNSGSLPWQFNESFPMAACTSAVDYFGRSKPAYFAVARAYEPLHLSARFDTIAWASRERFGAEVWLSSSLPKGSPISGTLESRLVGACGRLYGQQQAQGDFGQEGSTRLAEISWPLTDLEEDIFFLDLRLLAPDGNPISSNRYIFSRSQNLAPLLVLPSTVLSVQWGGLQGSQARVTNTGEFAALFVWLEDERPVDAPGSIYFSDNHFCLLPGESWGIEVEWDSVPPEQRSISLRGWNTPEVRI